jgi:hypothetical protein
MRCFKGRVYDIERGGWVACERCSGTARVVVYLYYGFVPHSLAVCLVSELKVTNLLKLPCAIVERMPKLVRSNSCCAGDTPLNLAVVARPQR